MEKESSDSKLASGSVPMLGPDSVDLDFKSWINAMKALVNSLSGDFNLLTDPAPDVPLGVLEIAGIAHATVRRVEEARREMYVDWKKAQKRACALLLTSVSQNKNAKNLLATLRAEAVVQPPLQDGENLPIVQLLDHLRNHYIPVNELRAIKTEKSAKNILLKRNEPLTKFLVRFEDAINDAAAQGKIFTLVEKRAMLDTGLRSGEKVMDNLVTSLQMQMADMTWMQVTTYLSRFDDTSLGSARLLPEKPKASRLDSVAAVEKMKCSHCKKNGHSPDKCWQLHPELTPKWMQEKKKKGGGKKRKKESSDKEKSEDKSKKSRKEWPPLVEEEDSASMLGDDLTDTIEELLLVEDESFDEAHWIFLDTCASRTLFIVKYRQGLSNFRKCRRNIGTASKDGLLPIRGEGMIGRERVDHCPNLRRSILSLGRIHSWGMTIKLPPDGNPVLVNSDGDVIIEGIYHMSMPCFHFDEIMTVILALPEQSSELSMIDSAAAAATTRSMDRPADPVIKDRLKIWEGAKDMILPQKHLTDFEKMELLHFRMGHIYVKRLTDGYMRMRYEGYTVPRSMLREKTLSMLPKCVSCYRSKQRRHHMHASTDMINKYFTGECMWLDIHVFVNAVGYDGTAYFANFTDCASGATLSYSLKSKDYLVDCFQLVLEDYHLRYGFKWKVLHSDQELVVLSNRAREWLHDHQQIQTVTAPTDTPEMNGPAEVTNKVLAKMTMSMLHHSGRAIEFWPAAYEYAVQIKFVMPIMTLKGFMSPYEYLTGRVPNISHFRVWGSKCFVLEPRVEHRKDWHAPSVVGFFLKLSLSPSGYEVWVPELHDSVVSIDVEFDESIPDAGVEYHRDLEDHVIIVAKDELSVGDLKKRYLGKHFIEEDNGLLYEVVGIRALKDRTIVADVRLVGGKKRSRSPLHVADMMRMVDEPKNSEAVARALQEAIDVQQTRAENSTSYRDSLILLEDTCKSVDPRVGSIGDDMYITSDDVFDDTLSGLPITGSTTSEVRGDSRHCCEFGSFDDDTGDSVSMVTDAMVDAVEAIDPPGLAGMSDAPRNRHAMLQLPVQLKEQFLAAEDRELSSIQERNVVECECPIPKGVRPIDSRMVYAWKDPVAQVSEDTSENTEKPARMAKARLVMKDFKNRADDLRETFAPTGKGVTFRLLMLLCTVLLIQCDHIDVNTAFLYADLVTPLYMNPPSGFGCKPGNCWKIVKALYGCRTAPREWYKVLRLFVLSLGFIQTVLDPCLFYYGAGEMFMLIYFYVDDILLFTKYGTEYGEMLKRKFFERFKCKDLGRIKRFLGVWVEQAHDFSSLCLHQRPYCEKIVEKYREYWCAIYPTAKKTPLPLDVQERLAKEEPNPTIDDKYYGWWNSFPYLQMIGAALYLAINTRVDIMFSVCMLARFSKIKSVAACKALCWMYSYLSGSVEIGIKFGHFVGNTFTDVMDLLGFSDADWASDLRSRRSTAGFIVFCCGGPLAWGSKLMTTIAASSMESEYMSAYYLGQMLLFIRNLLGELRLKLTKPTPFFMDAMAAILALKNPVYHARSKHVAIKWHWLRQHIGTNFALYHVRTGDMSADLLTKMAIFRVWSSLLPHMIGEEVRSSDDIIAAQSREKGADFPKGGVEKP